MDELLQEFIAETRETLEALSGEIVAWEADPADRQRLDAIFRFVHTVKGSCGFLELPRLGRLSHAAEDVLAAVRAGERQPDQRLVNAVLAIVDRIGELVEAIDAGASLDDSGEDLLIAALADGSDTVAQSAAVTARAPARNVRLSVDLLDRMMSGMSDMVLARNELARRLRESNGDPAIEASLERMSQTVAELRDTVTRTRMQKIEALFSALPRMVRDTAAGLGKSVALQVEGADVELDREMIEMLRDPLVHIVRNAIDHGIESPAERRAAGKRENGRLTIAARQSGNQIIIEITDDGRGVDVERLLAKPIANGARREHELRGLSEQEKLQLVFEPGLTTKDEVSEVSGRGVGMDVVKANIEQIGGRIDLRNSPGRGLHIAISVPLTLSIITTIGVSAGGQRFALPRQAIEEIVATRGDAIRIDLLGQTGVATVRGRRLPLVDLAGLLGLGAGASEAAMLVIVSVPGGSYALTVDAVLDIEELVVKPAAPGVMATGLYAGQTLPDSGLPMLLLDSAGLAAVAGLRFSHQLDAEPEPTAEAEPTIPALLFRDLDGAIRAAPLAAVDRVEMVEAAAMRTTAGRPRLTLGERTLPLVLSAPLAGRAEFGVLRLHDGLTEIGYVIAEALDIVALPAAMVPASNAGAIAGVVVLDGEQVELIDTFWLFAHHAEPVTAPAAPLCLIAPDAAGWMRSFLQPTLEAAGYRVASEAPAGELPAVLLAMDVDAPASASAPVIRLHAARDGGPDSIFRYDRARLLDAIARSTGART